MKAPTIASAIFDQWCCRYGVPERLHSDGARNVHGSVMIELSKLLGVDKSKSSRLHPQGDGMSESFVKQLKRCVQKQVDEKGTDWDLYMHATAFAVRSNLTYNSKISPSELIIGSKLVQPIDDAVNEKPVTGNKQAHDYTLRLRKKIFDSNKTVQAELNKSREKMKKQFDKSAKNHRFTVGSKVMLWKPYKRSGLSKCFQPNWNGPWTIEHFTNDTNSNCKIKCCSTNKSMNVHVSQLKPISNDNPTQNHSDKGIRDAVAEPVHAKTPATQDHYLEDFDEDELNAPVIENHVVEADHLRDGMVDVPVNEPVNAPFNGPVEGVHIDNAWVDIDVSNILPGRTRGARQDYQQLASGDG